VSPTHCIEGIDKLDRNSPTAAPARPGARQRVDRAPRPAGENLLLAGPFTRSSRRSKAVPGGVAWKPTTTWCYDFTHYSLPDL